MNPEVPSRCRPVPRENATSFINSCRPNACVIELLTKRNSVLSRFYFNFSLSQIPDIGQELLQLHRY